jgi:hypothetical protein
MEEWNTLVRKLTDEQEDQKQFQELAKAIFRWLTTHKIKDMRKFEQRLGNDYEQLMEDLKNPMLKDLLENDEFFELSLKLRKKYKV